MDKLTDIEYEIWKDINVINGVDYTGYYRVSNFGRVKSLERTVKRRNGSLRTVKERIMVQTVFNKEYLKVGLSKYGKVKNMPVHRLVAIAFIPNPLNKPQINHIDSNPSNNHVNNLEWVTPKENMRHAIEFGNMNGILKKDTADVIKLYKNGRSAQQISKIYKVGAKTITGVLKRNNIFIRNKSQAILIKNTYDKQKIIDLYQLGAGSPKIAKLFNISESTILKILHTNNIKVKSNSEAQFAKQKEQEISKCF